MPRHPVRRFGFARRHRGTGPSPLLAAAALVAVLLLVQQATAERPGAAGSVPLAARPSTAPAAVATSTATRRPVEPAGRSCAARVAGLSGRDKLAQRLMVGVDPADPAEARAIAIRTHVGGVFIGGNSTRILSGGAIAGIQSALPVPLAVAVDEEGGRVQRIDALAGSMPSAQRLGTLDADAVRRIAAERGRRLRALGVTVDMAPVVDIGGASDDPVIGDRAFSRDPRSVVTHAGAFAAGLRDAGVEPVFKHFPGHGRATGDSHAGLVTTPPLTSLRAIDLVPYRQLFGEGRSAVMVGHLDVPGLTGGVPATLSAPAYRLLRGELGFSGVTITDDLGAMRAVSDRYGLVDAVALALESGADIGLWTSTAHIDDVLDRLTAETAAGRLTGTDAAVGRILLMKGLCDA